MRPNPMCIGHQAHCDNGCTCEFPHEIGYFLGYPYDDVHEFIVQHGENYKVFGHLGRSTRMSGKRLRRSNPTALARSTSPMSISRATA